LLLKNSNYWISGLNLAKHPEGGYYSEVYRSEKIFQDAKKELSRNLSTSIYYLLEHHEVSVFHRIKSDELWYYHYGSPMLIHSFDLHDNYNQQILGAELKENQSLQILIPAGTIFAAEVLYPEEYSLVGCMVTPGFDFDDFEIIPAERLESRYPEYEEIIQKLS
jgi:predicted cupin superfamily sugar epimerase